MKIHILLCGYTANKPLSIYLFICLFIYSLSVRVGSVESRVHTKQRECTQTDN